MAFRWLQPPGGGALRAWRTRVPLLAPLLLMLVVPGQSTSGPSCESGGAQACRADAVQAARAGQESRERALRQRAKGLELATRLSHALRGIVTAVEPPSPPPMVAIDETHSEPRRVPLGVMRVPDPTTQTSLPAADAFLAPPLISADEADPPAAPADIDLGLRGEVAPPSPPPKLEPTSRVGIVALAGGELVAPLEGGVSLRPRLGLGLRVALMDRPTSSDALDAMPSLGIVAGYAGLADQRIFGELRLELALAPPGGLFQPAFSLYAITGTDVIVSGGVDPYVGAGLGWDVNIFKGDPKQKPAKSSVGLGGGWGGGLGGGLALLPVAVIAAVAILGFICVGRVEVRYHPISSRLAPATMTVLLGYGF